MFESQLDKAKEIVGESPRWCAGRDRAAVSRRGKRVVYRFLQEGSTTRSEHVRNASHLSPCVAAVSCGLKKSTWPKVQSRAKMPPR